MSYETSSFVMVSAGGSPDVAEHPILDIEGVEVARHVGGHLVVGHSGAHRPQHDRRA